MTRASTKLAIGALAVLALATSAGCKRTKWYESKVKLVRVQNVHPDASGRASDADVEFSWGQCPGSQVEIVRGDAAFADCMKKYKVGDEVAVKIEHHWDEKGYWDWDVHEFGGCKRPPDPKDQSSFDTVQECEPVVVNGVNEGFHCNRLPQRELLKKCPWFGRY